MYLLYKAIFHIDVCILRQVVIHHTTPFNQQPLTLHTGWREGWREEREIERKRDERESEREREIERKTGGNIFSDALSSPIMTFGMQRALAA